MSVKIVTLGDPVLTNLLENGKIAVIPTDTVYGIVCKARDSDAVQRLYGMKLREHKPGTVIAASVAQLVELGLKHRYLKPVESYWPNPISVVIPCTFELPYLHLGVGSLAVRVVKDEGIARLLEKTGPLLTTSANHPGQPEARTIAEAQKYFGDEVDVYVDGGDLSGQKPSTVMRIVDDMVEVLREGAVKINEKGEIE